MVNFIMSLPEVFRLLQEYLNTGNAKAVIRGLRIALDFLVRSPKN